MTQEHFEALQKNPANFVPLSPLSFIRRTASLYPDQQSIIYGDRVFTWEETYARSCRCAHALQQAGIGIGDTVSVLAPNVPAVIEAQFSVPMAGAVLNSINYRLEADTVGYILEHSDAKLVFVDAQFVPLLQQAQAAYDLKVKMVVINDPAADQLCSEGTEYEDFIAAGSPQFDWQMPTDEWNALALNYTSGTSGRPKGVVYHHRGSYLMSMGSVLAWGMQRHPTYLYTVPLFHCNGWGYVWTVCLLAGSLVCLRQIDPAEIFRLIEQHKITHFGGAPVVLSLLINADPAVQYIPQEPVQVMTAGAPPPPPVIKDMHAMNFEVMQVYGLTETYGHISHCVWQEKWNDLHVSEQAEIKSWQGVCYPMNEDIALFDQHTKAQIPLTDHRLAGEVCIRGNTVMKGYYKDPQSTRDAFSGGWFHSGDLAAWQDCGYLQIRDRIKDVIISGGENISSVEIEKVLYQHPSVAHVAVVAQSDEKWGEVPAAYIELKAGAAQIADEELIELCRGQLAGFKVPKRFYFCQLPKTATGKIQKFLLR